ncbi:MAG: hypothetical protein R6W86_12955 [Marinobacter sp.]|uniref:hypothetical protein n=1 Tax=Marinobacter sp. TaxID=50741 RepID=UPI00396D69CD
MSFTPHAQQHHIRLGQFGGVQLANQGPKPNAVDPERVPGNGLAGVLVNLPCQLAGYALIVRFNTGTGRRGLANHQHSPGGGAFTVLTAWRAPGLRQPGRCAARPLALVQQYRKEQGGGQPEREVHRKRLRFCRQISERLTWKTD